MSFLSYKNLTEKANRDKMLFYACNPVIIK